VNKVGWDNPWPFVMKAAKLGIKTGPAQRGEREPAGDCGLSQSFVPVKTCFVARIAGFLPYLSNGR
jgi:hypothetical protein